MAIYMEYEGIKGNVTADGYEGMIKLDFAWFGTRRSIKMTPGELSNRECVVPTFEVLKTGKKLEQSTPPILKQMCASTAGRELKLHFVRTGANQLQEIMTCTFAGCIPSFYRFVVTARDGAIPVERLYLSYSAIEISQKVHDASHKSTQTFRTGYDLATARFL
jgi:type VI secretion system secreted protein Hcp